MGNRAFIESVKSNHRQYGKKKQSRTEEYDREKPIHDHQQYKRKYKHAPKWEYEKDIDDFENAI